MLKRLLMSLFLGLGLPSFCTNSSDKHPFEEFLNQFMPKVASKSAQLNKAVWILETTGNADAADLVADLSTEVALLFNNPEVYQKLLKWNQDSSLKDPILKRQLNVLIRSFKQNAIAESLLTEIARKEAALSYSYANFRPSINGKTVSENEILDLLKKEQDPVTRRSIWMASKEIGMALAPQILDLVELRNQAAKSLGYKNYFDMQLDLQEVQEKALFELLETLETHSHEAYETAIREIQDFQAKKFSVELKDLGPWAWTEPFCQEDPVETAELDSLMTHVDLLEAGKTFYQRMGVNIEPILKKSDMFERPGKNQHAFCINMDRKSDIRTLNNIKPTLKWLETVLHELGHAIYELGLDQNLPWILRTPPHMIPTEAMALMAGRRAYLKDFLSHLPSYSSSQDPLIEKCEKSLKRRQLIFSRWVLVMTYFEKALYENPKQDLNALWWSLVAKYQKIQIPEHREGKNDWAAKYHIGLAPVYYYSYLLGELFASAMEETMLEKTGLKELSSEANGLFLNETLFFPGNRFPWDTLIEQVVGKPLSADAWIRQFAD